MRQDARPKRTLACALGACVFGGLAQDPPPHKRPGVGDLGKKFFRLSENDPAAGSPTATLLRLLLPLLKKYR